MARKYCKAIGAALTLLALACLPQTGQAAAGQDPLGVLQVHDPRRHILADIASCVEQNQKTLFAPIVPEHPVTFSCLLENRGKTSATIVAVDGQEFVLEDQKMYPSAMKNGRETGCAKNNKAAFDHDPLTQYASIHMDAIPLAVVTGDEDPHASSLQNIWSFAWDVGEKFPAINGRILLAANPVLDRTQDQLHIHIVAITSEAKQRFLNPSQDVGSAAGGLRPRVAPAYVDKLEDVWTAAEANAHELGQKLGIASVNGSWLESGRFGVAVTYDAQRGKYAVAATVESPEEDYADLCRP